MMDFTEVSSCPCCSGQMYEKCCGRYLDGDEAAPTAEALMRSRYTAYVLKRETYLLASWHDTTRPADLGLDKDEDVEWQGLVIKAAEKGGPTDDRGTVEFVATFTAGGNAHRMHEKSRFVKEEGRWFYVDGDVKAQPIPAAASKVGRNEPCPCGSGKKYKKCCLAKG